MMQAILILVASATVLTHANPSPMESSSDPSRGHNENLWWLEPLNQALHQPWHDSQTSTPRPYGLDLLQQHSSFDNFSPHTFPVPAQTTDTRADATNRWTDGQSSSVYPDMHDAAHATDLHSMHQQYLPWANGPRHKPSIFTGADSFHQPDYHYSFPEMHAEGLDSLQSLQDSSEHSSSGALREKATSPSFALTDFGKHAVLDPLPVFKIPPRMPAVSAPQIQGQSSKSHADETIDLRRLKRVRSPDKKKIESGSIAASKFLEHHPQLEQNRHVPMAVSEMSADASVQKSLINKLLFSDHLIWLKKGDDMLGALYRDEHLNQFIHRINVRESWFTAKPQAPWLEKQLVVVPHRSYAKGSVMFDPEPEASSKTLLFSFWTPAVDIMDRHTRLQFVGSASLKIDDATEVLRKAGVAEVARGEAAVANPRSIPHVAPLRNNMVSSGPGPYTASKAWLRELPLVEQILPEDSPIRRSVSDNLMSQIHEHADQIRETANRVLFGGSVVWQRTPTEAMLDSRREGTVGIFRYHKRSKILYLSKPEILQALPYRIVLIPYEIQSPRAKLFDASLGGHSLAFTLWASQDTPGGRYANRYLFVGGGAVNIRKTASVVRHAQTTLKRLAEGTFHAA